MTLLRFALMSFCIHNDGRFLNRDSFHTSSAAEVLPIMISSFTNISLPKRNNNSVSVPIFNC
jgi:hypothetical protein